MRPTVAAPIIAIAATLAVTPAVLAADPLPPAEQRAPNGSDQRPAFSGQTRAPQSPDQPTVRAQIVAEGMPQLWAMEFLPDGRMLVTAKRGSMHIIDQDGTVGPALEGVPEVDARRQGGLLDVALAPDFADSGTIVFSYSEPRGNGRNGTSVARANLNVDGSGAGALSDVDVIFRQTPDYAGTMHYGSRLAFAPDGTLFITTGERSDRRVCGQAQDLSSGLGKVFRINLDGSIPSDNPFVGQSGAQPAIWSYGHRNPQSAIVSSDGDLWTVSHGPRGGDELNRPQAGRNYGWPVITYGIEYRGSAVGDGITQRGGMEQPIYYWDPVIAPSGMAEYRGSEIPEWDGAFLVGGLVSQGIVVLHLEDGRVAFEDRVPLGSRTRDVRVGPDGAVYAVTDQRGGTSAIVRLSSASSG
ncbi:MAG: PQQ-dependent sugar dehydrogenase [Pseudomonadota bacterium]